MNKQVSPLFNALRGPVLATLLFSGANAAADEAPGKEILNVLPPSSVAGGLGKFPLENLSASQIKELGQQLEKSQKQHAAIEACEKFKHDMLGKVKGTLQSFNERVGANYKIVSSSPGVYSLVIPENPPRIKDVNAYKEYAKKSMSLFRETTSSRNENCFLAFTANTNLQLLKATLLYGQYVDTGVHQHDNQSESEAIKKRTLDM